MMAHEIVVDPFLLCLPNPCNSLEELEEYIFALVGWRGFLERHDTCILLSDSVRAALNDDNEFPHRHRLSELIHQFGCKIADANTISKVANTILQRAPTLEDHFGLKSVLIDDRSFSCEPASILDRLKENCKKAFKEDLLIAAVKDNDRADEDNGPGLMVTSRLGALTLNPEFNSVDIKADIHGIELTNNDIAYNLIPLSQKLPIFFSHERLIKSLDFFTLWNDASSVDAVRSCIDACITNLIRTGTSDKSVNSFVIGNGFIDSLHKWGASRRQDFARVTVESCARVILGIPKNQINVFRESSDGSAKQRNREDGALAYRTHLTKSGVGLRLMFWKHTDGKIEFANIGGKDELEII